MDRLVAFMLQEEYDGHYRGANHVMHFIIITEAVTSIVLFDINITIITITINLEKESRKSEKLVRYVTYVYYLLL